MTLRWGMFVIFLLGSATGFAQGITFGPDDRLIVLAPHPDDEILGCAGMIQHALAAKRPVRVVFLTLGDANEWSFIFWNKRPVIAPSAVKAIAQRRSREALAAASVLGLRSDDVIFLGYPDHGTEAMLLRHWGDDRPPGHGNFTRARSVPYSFAFRPNAPYRGESVLADLDKILREFRPTRVCVSSPADQHPDHHALYLYATIALWDLEPDIRPAVYPFLVHFPKWPLQKGLRATEKLTAPEDLTQVSWVRLPLTERFVELKHEALKKHETQYNYSANRLLPLVRSEELFGDMPRIVLKEGQAVSEIRDDEDSTDEAIVPELIDPDEQAGVEAAFVDVEKLELRVADRQLQATVYLDRALPKATSVTLYFLGWKKGVEFARMPKLTIRVGAQDHSVGNNGATLRRSGVTLDRATKQMKISIPLALLGAPERLLVGARSSAKQGIFDQVPWRTVEIRPAGL